METLGNIFRIYLELTFEDNSDASITEASSLALPALYPISYRYAGKMVEVGASWGLLRN
jgi:hypothetical protein